MRRRANVRAAAFATLLLLACTGGEGPFDLRDGGQLAHLSVEALVDGPALTPPALHPATLQATLFEPGSMAIVRDTTLSVVPGQQVDLDITVRIEAQEETFLLVIVLRNDQGQEIYRSEPSTVIARATGSGVGSDPVQIVLSYTGPGAGSSRLEVTPEQSSVRFGESTVLDATAFAEDGSNLGSVPVDWTTLDPQLVTLVDAEAGRWQAEGVRGTARVIASFEPTGLADTASVEVTPLPGAIDIVSGSGQDGSAGSPLDAPVVVRVEGTDGLPIEGEDVVFAATAGGSAAPTTAQTDADGVASAVWTLGADLGQQTLTATVAETPGLSVTFTAEAGPPGLARIVVTPGSLAFDALTATSQLAAAGFDVFDNPFPISTVTWTSSAPSVVSVSPSGVVTATGNGTAQITASSEGVTSAPVAVVVEQVPVEATISPGSGWEVAAGATLSFSATARDRLGLTVAGSAFSWTSSNPGVLSIDGSGTATGAAPGSATVTATLLDDPSITASASGTVLEPGLARIVVTPAAVTLDALTDTTRLTPAGFDTFDDPFPLSDVAWTSSAPSVATVSPSGVVTAVGNGTAEVRASSEGVTSAPVAVRVEQVPVTATISPESGWEVTVGEVLTFGATARDRLGLAIVGAAFSWSSSDPGVLSIDGSGAATGVAAGPATVTATVVDAPSVTDSSPGRVLLAPPAAPSDVTATPEFPGEGSFTGFGIRWRDQSSDEDRFWVERSLDGGASWSTVNADVPANTDTLYDGGPDGWPQDTQVLHRVRACAETRCSSPAETPAPSVTSPELPTDIAAFFLQVPTTLRVTWTDTNTYETGYRVRLAERTCSGTISAGTFTVGPNVTSVDIPNLTANGDYNIYVRSENDTESGFEVLFSIGVGPLCGDL